MSRLRLHLEHRRQRKENESIRGDDATQNPQWVVDALVSLLNNDKQGALTQTQADAIRHIRAAGTGRCRDKVKASFHRRWGKMRAKSIEETFVEIDKEDDRDEPMLETINHVLHCFGGERFQNTVVVHTRKGSKKEILLERSPRRSGARLDWMANDYNQVGSRRLRVTFSRLSTIADSLNDGSEGRYYCPPEWETLAAEEKAELATLLSWENMSKWDFDILAVTNLTRDPLLLVGWALLCPTAQEAIDLSLGPEEERNIKSYDFDEHMKIDCRTVCNFLRKVEKRYKHDNPFHSNIHAADVTQTLHCLLQMMDEEHLSQISDPVTIFSLLLAATFHDVGHPGTNNLFEQNKMTSSAIRYNDVSILENMHSAIGQSLLFGEERRKEWDVFGEWSPEEKARARNIMITSVLGTDMSGHFASLDALYALIGKVETLDCDSGAGEGEEDASEPVMSTLVRTLGSDDAAADDVEECNKLITSLLKFVLHAADISNPAKKEKLCVYWADGALAEFFAQGDKEKEMKLPVSPLCDRDTTKRPDSQIGFIQFVIKPTFALLGEIIPKVNEEVLPEIESNLRYWREEKSRLPQSAE